MKKKIFLITLLASLFAFVLAIYVSAAEIPEWTEIIEVDGMADKATFGEDGTKGASSRVLMSDGITYPAYYICKNSTTLGVSFSDLNTKTGKSYKAVDVVRIEIPNGAEKIPYLFAVSNGYTALATVVIPEGVTTIESSAFSGKDDSNHSSLVSVTIPSTVTTIGEKAFYCCNSLEELVLPEGLTAIPTNMAYHAYSLKYVNIPSTVVSIGELAFRANSLLSCEIVIPEGCTTIGASVFKGTGVTSVTLPSTLESLGKEIFSECPALTSVNSKSPIIGVQMFYHCNELSTIKLENTIEIGNLAFNNSSLSKVSSLELPEGLTTIGEYAFPRMSITSVVIPSTVVNIDEHAFTACKSLEKVVVLGPTIGTNMFYNCFALRTLVLTESFETFGADALVGVPQDSFTTYYTGTDYERIKTLCSNSTRLSQAGTSTYADYVSGNYTSKKFMLIYDCNICTVGFDGNHAMSGNEIMNFVSFLEQITFTDTCTREGCGKEAVKKTIAPLFVNLGYSASEYDGAQISVNYKVNMQAVKDYEKATGETVSYGVFAALADKIGANDIFGADGKVLEGVIAADITGSGYTLFNLKITGFTEAQKKLPFAMGAFVGAEKNGSTEYSYLQIAAPAEGEKYYFATYNEAAKLTPSDDEESAQ